MQVQKGPMGPLRHGNQKYGHEKERRTLKAGRVLNRLTTESGLGRECEIGMELEKGRRMENWERKESPSRSTFVLGEDTEKAGAHR